MGFRKTGLVLVLALFSIIAQAQNGTVTGTVYEKTSGESLIGATVMLQGTSKGAMVDFEGNFLIPNVEPGTYDVVCSFVSYESQVEHAVQVKANEEVSIDFLMEDASVQLGGVEVVAKMNRESEGMMLIEQRKAGGIKESIGSSRLSELGVSDAAAATSKISGVAQSEESGEVYIRGLGDRYLSTSMNGLPIPSDDVEKKNIDLNLFSTEIISNVGINKTYSVENSGDQASGNVDVVSKTQADGWSVGLSANTNTNVISNGFSNFRASQNVNDLTMGFYNKPYSTEDAITKQSWNTTDRKFPLGYDFSLSYGHTWDFANERKLRFFATLDNSSSSDYQKGSFSAYDSNYITDRFDDVETFTSSYNTTALASLEYNFNNNNFIHFNTLSIFKTKDELYESGRSGDGLLMDKDIYQNEEGAFVRDQNTKVTQIFINQLIGNHKLTDKNELDWALGYNKVNADEPNRIRNEMYLNPDDGRAYFYNSTNFDNMKSKQDIKDAELNGFVKDEHLFVDEDNKQLKLTTGANFRSKSRDFSSQFVGVNAKGLSVASIDNLDPVLNNDDLDVENREPDLYSGDMLSAAAYANLGFVHNKLSGNFGIRYEYDEIKVDWDVNNYEGRVGSTKNNYNNFLPSLGLKYQLKNEHALRFVASKTVTLPELKELAPFVYSSPSGRKTMGNPELENSDNYNFDLKWEYFPTRSMLFSATGFYKLIKNPISSAIQPGAAGNFTYANTGDKATVYGIEAEARFPIVKATNLGQPKLDLTLNGTKMWTKQDLYETYQYYNVTETELAGAADFIFNGALSFSTNTEYPFVATLSANYTGDRIYALGAPKDQAYRDELFNSEIIEKGFATLNLVLTKKVNDVLSLKLSGKNLLNPTIEQTQEVVRLSGYSSDEVVSSYKRGVDLSFGIVFNF